MFIVVGVWISPLAVGALALGVGLGLRGVWWAVLIVVAASAALAVAAAIRIAGGTERRGRLATARWPVQQQLRAGPATQLPQAERPAIGPVYNLNFYGVPEDERAAIIHTALPGTPGEITPE